MGKNDTRSEAYDKLKDAYQKLRAENRNLKKRLKACEKQLHQSLHREFEATMELEEELFLEVPEPKKP